MACPPIALTFPFIRAHPCHPWSILPSSFFLLPSIPSLPHSITPSLHLLPIPNWCPRRLSLCANLRHLRFFFPLSVLSVTSVVNSFLPLCVPCALSRLFSQFVSYRIPGKRPTFSASQEFNSPKRKVPASNIRLKKSWASSLSQSMKWPFIRRKVSVTKKRPVYCRPRKDGCWPDSP